MIKDPSSSYKPGRRGREWLKLKKALATLDVVVTTVELGHGKRRSAGLRSRSVGRNRWELLSRQSLLGLTDGKSPEMTEWFRERHHPEVSPMALRCRAADSFRVTRPGSAIKPPQDLLRFPRIVPPTDKIGKRLMSKRLNEGSLAWRVARASCRELSRAKKA
jgi:ATP-dependent DNA ligase